MALLIQGLGVGGGGGGGGGGVLRVERQDGSCGKGGGGGTGAGDGRGKGGAARAAGTWSECGWHVCSADGACTATHRTVTVTKSNNCFHHSRRLMAIYLLLTAYCACCDCTAAHRTLVVTKNNNVRTAHNGYSDCTVI